MGTAAVAAFRRVLRSQTPAAFLAFLVLAVTAQWMGGAYTSEFGEAPDEAAHFITSLMVRDYLAAGAPWPPMDYAVTYYEHYPKVALGHWPPLFYAAQGMWTLVFSPSRVSVMALQAFLAALWGTLLFYGVKKRAPAWLAFAAGIALILNSMSRLLTREVMTEIPVALLVLCGCLLWARYLDEPQLRHSIAFGAIAAIALLTKGTGVLLALLPPATAALSGRLRLLRSFHFWVPYVLIFGLAGPWYLLAPDTMHEHAIKQGALNYGTPARVALRIFASNWLRIQGWFLLPLVSAGIALRVAVPLIRRERTTGIWTVALASFLSMAAMCVYVPPSRELRHMLLILPLLLMLAIEGLGWLGERPYLAGVPSRWRTWALACLLLVLSLSGGGALPPKDYGGFGAVARDLLGRLKEPKQTVLVSSDSSGEGMFISEFAAGDRRPGHRILRGSRVLSTSDWFGKHAALVYFTPGDVDRFLNSAAVAAVVLDEGAKDVAIHHDVLQRALSASPREWRLAGVYPKRQGYSRPDGEIRLYLPAKERATSPEFTPSQLPDGLLKYRRQAPPSQRHRPAGD